MPSISDLIGRTVTRIERPNSGEVIFICDGDGTTWRLFHYQDCCESVYLDDVAGDLADLTGTPIVMAEESTRNGSGEDGAESRTWTFYKFATARGYVTLTWRGDSNGYYSESVDFEQIGKSA